VVLIRRLVALLASLVVAWLVLSTLSGVLFGRAVFGTPLLGYATVVVAAVIYDEIIARGRHAA
jgi:hypothetical protein